MKSVVNFTLRQTVFINLVFVLLMVVGVFSVLDVSVEQYPNVDMGKVLVTAYLPGAGPDEVEALVTRKIEDAIEDVENVEYVRSTSYRQRCSIMVKFLDDTDYDSQYDELRFKILAIQNDLPERMDPPQFTRIDVNEWLPVLSINLTGQRTNRALTLMAEELRVPLKRIPGVKEVKIDGEHTREFHVTLDPERMERLGVTFDEVAQALDSANVSVPAGDFETDHGEYVILVDEQFRTRQQVADAVVRIDADGSFVRVGDVMDQARVDYRDPYLMTSVNGESSVSVKVLKTAQGNALDIGGQAEQVLAGFLPKLTREGVKAVISQDMRVRINDSLDTLGMNLLVGIVLVTGLIWWLMGFRNAMLTTVGIPFSFLVTMILVRLTGSSLNEITLFSFVLVSGIIVDDAIVVMENVFRHIQEGKPIREAVVNGTSEVFLPVVAATSTTVAAFLPMLIMSGSTGEFFAEVPKAVSFAIGASLLECLFILPLHIMDWPGAGRMIERAQAGELSKEPRFMGPLRSWTMALVAWARRRRWLVLAGVLGSFFAAMVIMVLSLSGAVRLINVKFFPEEYSLYYVDLVGPEGTSVRAMDQEARKLAKAIADWGPGVTKSATAMAGMVMNDDYENVLSANLAFLIVELPADQDRDFPDGTDNDPAALLDWVRTKLEPMMQPGWSMRVWPEQSGPPAGKDVNIRVLGTDMAEVEALAEGVMDWLHGNEAVWPYLSDVEMDTGTPSRIFRFEPLTERAAEYGLTPDRVALLAGSILDGRFVGQFRLSDEDVDLRLKIDPAFLQDPEDALDIPLLQHEDGPLKLGDLCAVSTYTEPGQLNRFQSQRAVAIKANIRPGAPISATSLTHDVRQWYHGIQGEHPGAALNFAGEFEATRRSFTSLAYAFIIALMLMYMILATQFSSYLQPAVIISAVVFALTGVIFGTLVTRSLFTINSFIATVGVAGVVVNDSLVLLEFMNRIYRRTGSIDEAIREGVRIRLRPILLTTLTTTLGLLPMAVGFPDYSVTWGTMATTFVTGLCTATALTIFVLPVEWELIMRFTEKRKERKRRKQEAGQGAA